MSTEAKKFTFDVEFRPEGDLVSNAARARQRKVMTQEELDQLLTRARHDGMKMGQVRAAEATNAAIDQLCAVVKQSMDTADQKVEGLRQEAASLALVCAKKLAGQAVAALPQADVEEALREAMHQAISEPRIVLKATADVVDAIREKLEDLARDAGYEGRIVATAEPGMANGDCRIEWRGGGAERNMEHLEEAISDVITRRFSQVDSRKG